MHEQQHNPLPTKGYSKRRLSHFPFQTTMGHASLYSEDHFVVLETNQTEQILTAEELFEKLQGILADRPAEELPRDLQKFDNLGDRTRHLMDNACDLDMGPGEFLQWYAIRLEK